MRRLAFISLSLFALIFISATTLGATNEPQSLVSSLQSPKIDRALLTQLQQGKTTRALIVLNEQADLSGAEQLATKREKGRFVFNALREVAERTQARVRANLERQGIPYRAFYITNAIAVENLDAAAATLLASESSVMRIASDPNVRFPAPQVEPAAEAANGIEWGILKIRADKMWDKGFKGKGIVVANQDTGVNWDHPALKYKYRGYNGVSDTVDHSYNWWDAIHSSITGFENPCGLNLAAPCDDYGHGTHTMGTMVGRSGENRVGVAPKAKWIACRNMDAGVGRPTTYLECFEFFLAPWDAGGNNPDPDRAPDIVNNSWGCYLGAPPSGEGCEPASLKQATNSLRAAGIFLAMSAGNAGNSSRNGCGSITDPSSIYNASTTTGATNSNDALASFSSRGPVRSDDSRRKPDLAAPGVGVRSTIPGGGYGNSSGTSMASPHVAGAVASLWSARPNLRGRINQTENALFDSANRQVTIEGNNDQSCGGTNRTKIPNNLFGYGRLDAWKAYKISR